MESRACFVPWDEEHSEHRKNTGRRWPDAVELIGIKLLDYLQKEIKDKACAYHNGT